MKILITTDWYSPAINGVVTSVLNLKKELLLRGHEVKILTLSQSTHSFTRNGVTYIGSIGVGKVYPGARIKTAFTSKYIQEIIKWKPDIIHSQCEFSTFFLAQKIVRKLNIPIIHTYHTVYEDYTHYFSPNQKWGRHMVALISRRILKQTDCVIAPTEKVQAILKGYKVKQEIRVISTGIDLSIFTSPVPSEKLLHIKQSLGIPVDNHILLFVGRLAKEKNLEEILNYYANLQPKKTTLMIVGDGPHRIALEQLAKQLGIKESVVFTGMIAPEHIADYYHLGDLFVSASGSETQGLTYIEALASGLPALCHKDECLKDVIVNEQNGWQYENEEDFLEKLDLFLNSQSIRKNMSYAAKQFAEQKFSAASFAEKMEAVYIDVIRKAGSRHIRGDFYAKKYDQKEA